MTERDPSDDLTEALFEAARQERPDARTVARAKVLTRNALRGIRAASARERARAEPPRYFPALGAALSVLVALFVLVSIERAPERTDRVTTIIPEAIAMEARTPAPLKREPQAAHEQAENAAPKPATTTGKRERRAAPTLSEEIALLDEARTALGARDAARVIALVERYERELGGTRMRAEAELLRIEALAQSGQRAQAAKLALHFMEQHEGNPLAARARALSKLDSQLEEEQP